MHIYIYMYQSVVELNSTFCTCCIQCSVCLCYLQYFSTDDPDLYTTKIQYIRENDVTDLGVVFAEEEFIDDGHSSRVSKILLYSLLINGCHRLCL